MEAAEIVKPDVVTKRRARDAKRKAESRKAKANRGWKASNFELPKDENAALEESKANKQTATVNDHIRMLIRVGILYSKYFGQSCNGEKNGGSKLKTEQVELILKSNLSVDQLAEQYGVRPGTIQSIRNNRSWRHLPRGPKQEKPQH